MIRCFKCGTPATQDPDGTIHRACQCYQPSLIRTSEILSIDLPVTPISNESRKEMLSRHCPQCGEQIFSLLYHRCRGFGPVPPSRTNAFPPKVLPEEPEISPEQMHRMGLYLEHTLIEHLKTCESCQFLAPQGLSCFDCITINLLQEKWQKKAGKR